jgi:TrkA domain protein
MPVDLEETRLPGIGSKFTLRLDAGGRLAVILHNDGKRELYYFRHAADEEPRAVITLDDDEARQLGAIVGGAYERPKIVEDLEMALGELQIEWIPVPEDSPWIGSTLGESGFRAKTGITVIAILRQPEPITGAQPGDTIKRDDTLVTVGKAGQYPEFRRLLSAGEPGPQQRESSAVEE